MPDRLPPEQERRVRDLLADARHDGPPPPDVVARLEETLDRLRTERAEPEQPGAAAPADDLASRRASRGRREGRRRIAAAVLVAATLVVAGGVGIDRLAARDGAMTGAADSAGAGSDAGAAESQDRDPGLDSRSGDALEAPQEDAEDGMRSDPPAAPLTAEPTIDPTTLREDVLAIRDRAAATDDAGPSTALTCTPDGLDVGVDKASALAVTFDGRAGVLLLLPPRGEVQEAVVAACDGSRRVEVRLPAP